MRRDVGYGCLCLASAVWLASCSTRQGTAQVLTVAGAAAVIVGASLAADNSCTGVGGDAEVFAHCSARARPAVRRTGTAMAIAGAGVAAAGYALQPKGPDRLQPAPANALPPPAYSQRLVRSAAPTSAPQAGSEEPGAPAQEGAGAPEPQCAAPDDDGAGGGPCAPAAGGAERPEPAVPETGAADTESTGDGHESGPRAAPDL